MPHAANMDIRAAVRFCLATPRPAYVVLIDSPGGDMPTAYTSLSTLGQQGWRGSAFILYGLRAV
jgi:hypothetical protein